MPKNTAIAQALAGMAHPVMYEPGLEQPPEMNVLSGLNTVASGMGLGQMGGLIAKTLATKGLPALQGLGEAGAIFPEGPLPEGISKADMFTDAERQYKLWENTEKQYLHNNDFQNALKAKWGMLKNWGGSPD